jgi:hypothetical protein
MHTDPQKTACPDCDRDVDRRLFLKAVGGAAVLGATSSLMFNAPRVHAAPSPTSAAETVVAELYKSLSPEQQKTLVFPFDHELRSRISANWHITKATVKDLTKEQQALVDKIIRNVTTEDGYQRIIEQTEYDDGGVASYSIALFGNPDDKLQFEMTGRHLTMRADGNSVDKAAFGGPIVYGHGEESAKHNLFHYQTKQVNEVFKALDAKQAEQALVKTAPKEDAVKLQGESGKFPGISIGELSADQKELVQATLKTLLGPYREEDVTEVMEILKHGGGLDKLHLAFYQQGDLDNDKVWDIWRVEGPSLVWHFRGAPHVHAYVNIGMIG